MAKSKTAVRPTFKQLRDAAQGLGLDSDLSVMSRIDQLEARCIRLIQIQSEVKQLESEAGYTDPHSGERHPGIRDEVEKEFIKLNMFDGVQIEDFIIMLITGSGPDWIDPIELLRLGVEDSILKKATRPGRGWTAVRVQRKERKEHIGGAKF